jgi:hypothetical protein
MPAIHSPISSRTRSQRQKPQPRPKQWVRQDYQPPLTIDLTDQNPWGIQQYPIVIARLSQAPIKQEAGYCPNSPRYEYMYPPSSPTINNE